ncbi:MAG: VOC family protein [Candidatus Binatia bacterium]
MTAVDGSIHHIDLTASDLGRSTAFYDRVLPAMGFRRGRDFEGTPIWAGEGLEIGLQPGRAASRAAHDRYSPGLHHLAFHAPSREAVDRLHDELRRLGVEVLDQPAEYPHYAAAGYYAVFFADPDGVKLEYVYTPRWPA